MRRTATRLLSPFQSFVRSESAGGILLMVFAVVAFVWANSPAATSYEAMKQARFSLGLGPWELDKPLLLWVNDFLMAVFFVLVGLEIKRELAVGELADRKAAALPVAAAVGGMLVPAAIYTLFTWGTDALPGWGIPMATDIAFALGVMSLLGPRVPLSLKVFLTALAIVDDLGAILVIALFYGHGFELGAFLTALALAAVAFAYGRGGGRRLVVFAVLGLAMWYFMLKSGIHATVAGVLLALCVPLRREIEPRELGKRLASLFKGRSFESQEVEVEQLEDLVNRAQSPLHELEHSLQPWVAFLILPVFALFNAGFALVPGTSLAAPVSLAAFLGLLVGKPIGVFGASWLAVRLRWAVLGAGTTWPALAATGVLAGIGFTMSLFIAALAFGEGALLDQAKLGVLSASVVTALAGLALLWRATREKS